MFKYSAELSEEDKKRISNAYNAIHNEFNIVEPIFQNKLKRAVNRVYPDSDIIINRKSVESIINKLNKSKYESHDLFQITDLLRASILLNRKADPKKLIKALKTNFNIIKIDIKESTDEQPYGNAIHIDVKFKNNVVYSNPELEKFIFEIQIIRKNLSTYKDETHQYYKPSEEMKALLSELGKDPIKMRAKYFKYHEMIENAIKSETDRANKKENIRKILQEYENEKIQDQEELETAATKTYKLIKLASKLIFKYKIF